MHPGNDSEPTTPSTPRHHRLGLRGKAPRTRSVIVATGILVIGVSSVGIAATGSSLREGVRNGTTSKETKIIGNIASSTALTGGYVTRQSNLSSSGGGAVYGCRSQAGGTLATPVPQNPCVRANNLSKGLAFEFNSSNGDVVGSINTGVGGDTKKPFTTNATGVATGLNADRLDSLDASQIVTTARTGLASLAPFAQVKSDGTVDQTRGVTTSGGLTHTAASGIYTVKFDGDLSNCAMSATLTDTNGGEIAATPVVASGNTTVTVKTWNFAGTLTDRAFHLSAVC